MIRVLTFLNADASPKRRIVKVGESSIPLVMVWYGAYHAGDRYRVFVDGHCVRKDQNGELLDDLSGIPSKERSA